VRSFVIVFSRGVFLRRNYKPQPFMVDTGAYPNSGWRPILWTRELIDAEKFSTEEGARLFGMSCIPHEYWVVLETPTVLASGEIVA